MPSTRIAVKRIVEVEVAPASSHQHEFNAGRLRTELGFGTEKRQGTMRFFFYKADDEAPVVAEQGFTLYDAREAHETRTEWRLYYQGEEVATHSKAGDLVLMLRPASPSTDLVAVVIRSGTRVEREITRQLLAEGVDSVKADIAFIDSQVLNREGIESLLAPFRHAETEQPPLPYDYRTHNLYTEAIQSGEIPSTAVMAAGAHEVLEQVFPHGLDPDEFIEQALSAESELFFAIEDSIGNRELVLMMGRDGIDFARLMEFALSYSQARRSRRGESLQNHFAKLLDKLHIPYTAQCLTERGETPDFIVPGREAYHDARFPEERLRMVGCKTKVRERYRQWLKEADRVQTKYGLCVDDTLSDEVILRYPEQLRYFMPRQVIDTAYRDRATRNLLGSVSELVADLRVAANQ